MTIGTADYLKALPIPSGTYKEAWDSLGAQGNQRGNLADQAQTFQLPFKTMQNAVSGVTAFFGGMSVCEGSSNVNVTEKVHNLLLAGMFADRFRVLARGQIGFNADYGCVIKLTVRSLDQQVTQSLMECIK